MRNLSLVAALCGAPALILTAALPATAQAQAGVFAEPVIELAASGNFLGDGKTPVTLHLIALDSSGAPMVGLTGKLDNKTKIEMVSPGVYRAGWTPPSVDAAGSHRLTLRGKAPGNTTVSRTWNVQLTPPDSQTLTIRANPDRIVLGQDPSATVTMNLAGGAASTVDGGRISVASSSGSITNLTPVGGGRYSAMFTSPSQQYPHLAVITAVDQRDPDHSFGAVAVPMVGKANFPVAGMPNSRIIVRVGDREYGPVQADASGRAQVPIIVPPGVAQAFVISILGDKRTEDPLDLQVPASQRVKLVPSYASIPAQPNSPVSIRAFVAKADGGPDTNARVSFSATAGEISKAQHEGDGIYVATFTPPFGTAGSQVTVQVAVADALGQQNDALTIDLVPARPKTLSLSPEPATLASGVSDFKLFAKVAGADGVGMSGKKVDFALSGATAGGDLADLGSGDYQGSFEASDTGPVEIVASVREPATGNPLAQVLVLPARDHLLNDGRSTTPVAIVTLDSFGHPVGGVDLTLKVAGTGTLPTTTTTNDAGIAVINYAGTAKAGMARLTASTGDHRGSGLVLVAPAGVGADIAFPSSGSADALATRASWNSLITTVRIEREGLLGATVKPIEDNGVAGPIAMIEVTSEPSSVASGGTVTLKITAKDANGRGASGRSLQIVSSNGEVSSLQELGGGAYQATLAAAAGASGDIKLTVASPSGDVARLVSIPLVTGSAWGAPAAMAAAAAAATPPTEPAATEPAATEPAATEPAAAAPADKGDKVRPDHPWIRTTVGYSGGMYHYNERPLSTLGPLYNRTVTVGGGQTDPAGATGFEASGRVWLPFFEYVGADVGFRTDRWTLELPEGFDEPIVDWMNKLNVTGVARYPITLSGETRMHIGGRVGYNGGSFLVFKQELADDGSTTILYEPLWVNAMTWGAEVGTEFGKKGYADVKLDLGFTDYSGIYSRAFELTGGYAVLPHLLVYGTWGQDARSTTVWSETDNGKEQVGELDDTFNRFGVGIGYQR